MTALLIDDALAELKSHLEALMKMEPVLFGKADPPETSGVYMVLENDEIVYIGEAKGGGGLRDRILSKHLSGDDNHACQRALKQRFSDRLERRTYIKENVRVRWVEVDGLHKVAAVERMLIWLYNPPWNKK